MITPTINLNGSSIDDLVKPRLAAMSRLVDAIEALQQVTPHGRDYIGNDDAYTADRKEHFDRLSKLANLHASIMSEAVYIREQGQ